MGSPWQKEGEIPIKESNGIPNKLNGMKDVNNLNFGQNSNQITVTDLKTNNQKKMDRVK